MHVLHPQFTIGKVAERVHQTCFSQTDGLDLRTGEHNARSIGIYHFIIECGALIFNIYRSLFHKINQFSTTVSLLNMNSITAGQAINKIEERMVNLKRSFSAIFIRIALPSHTTYTI